MKGIMVDYFIILAEELNNGLSSIKSYSSNNK